MDSMGMMMARDKNGKLIKSAGRVDAVELPEKSSLPFSKGWSITIVRDYMKSKSMQCATVLAPSFGLSTRAVRVFREEI